MRTGPEHVLCAKSIGSALDTHRVGRRVVVLPEVESTNTLALELANGDAAALADTRDDVNGVQVYSRGQSTTDAANMDGIVLIAERQTRGRGRLGRVWQCPNGAGLTLTILLIEPIGATTPAAWMMTAGISVVRGIIESTDVTPSLRWPNDVYVNDRKLAGILVESRRLDGDREAVAIGIGINCLQQSGHFDASIRHRAISLDMLSRDAIDRHRVAGQVLSKLDGALGNLMHRDESRLIESWQAHSADIGAHVQLQSDGHTFRGRIIDVHPRDGVLVQLDDGGRRQFDPAVTTRA